MSSLLLLSVKEERVGESVSAMQLDFPKTIEIELSDKALELLMPEIFGNDFSFHSSNVEHINASFRGIPSDNVSICFALDKMINTLSSF